MYKIIFYILLLFAPFFSIGQSLLRYTIELNGSQDYLHQIELVRLGSGDTIRRISEKPKNDVKLKPGTYNVKVSNKSFNQEIFGIIIIENHIRFIDIKLFDEGKKERIKNNHNQAHEFE